MVTNFYIIFNLINLFSTFFQPLGKVEPKQPLEKVVPKGRRLRFNKVYVKIFVKFMFGSTFGKG
jgi:hypothetical protein